MPYVLLAFLAVLLWRRFQLRAAASREVLLDPGYGGGPPIEAVREMVQDPVCEAYVAKNAALTTVSGGRTWFFCSAGCYRRFLLGTARAAGE